MRRPASLNDPILPKGIALVTSLVVTALMALSIYFLFRPDASEWLQGKPKVDPTTFQ